MPVVETITGGVAALGGLFASIAITIIEAFFSIINRFGFAAYGLVMVALLFADIKSNLLGSIMTFMIKPFIPIMLTSQTLFMIAFLSYLTFWIYKARRFIHGDEG